MLIKKNLTVNVYDFVLRRLSFVSNVKHTVPCLVPPESLDDKNTVVPQYPWWVGRWVGDVVSGAPRTPAFPDALVPCVKWSSAKKAVFSPCA